MNKRKLRNNLRRFSCHIVPNTCVLCCRPTSEHIAICISCRQHLPFNNHACYCCALPLPTQAPADSLCGHCLNSKQSFDSIVAPFIYSEPISHLINGFKHRSQLWSGAVVADMLIEQLSGIELSDSDKPDCIMPIPLHWHRQFKRGFNQADWLARRISRKLNIPIDRTLIKRTMATPAQQGLNRKQRLRNLRHAFQLQKPFTYSNIAIVDDVITTASTLNIVAALLKRHGASKIYGWSLARTGLEKK